MIEKVGILANRYEVINGKFSFQDHFVEQIIAYCEACNAKPNKKGKVCSFCTANYHLSCMPKFCLCLNDPAESETGLAYSNLSPQKTS